MECVPNTKYWKHDEYEIYYDGIEIVVWKVPSILEGTFIVKELEELSKDEIFNRSVMNEAFVLAMDVLKRNVKV